EPEDDHHAIINQKAFSELIEVFPTFLNSLVQIGVKNIHLIAESGLPLNIKNYGELWYPENVQKPIREALLNLPLVETVSGKKVSISEARFIECESEQQEKFYSLVA